MPLGHIGDLIGVRTSCTGDRVIVVKLPILHDAMGVVAIRTFGVAIDQVALTEVLGGLDEILAAAVALLTVTGAYVMDLHACRLISTRDRHMARHGREVGLNVRHLKRGVITRVDLSLQSLRAAR